MTTSAIDAAPTERRRRRRRCGGGNPSGHDLHATRRGRARRGTPSSAAHSLRIRRVPVEQRVAERGEPAADDDAVDVGREHEQPHGGGDAVEEPRRAPRSRAASPASAASNRARAGSAVVGRPLPRDRRAGGERLEAAALAARAHRARAGRPGCGRSRRRRRARRASSLPSSTRPAARPVPRLR